MQAAALAYPFREALDKHTQCSTLVHVGSWCFTGFTLSGDVVAGLSVSTPFLRGALDKWRIGFTSYSREEYKGAVQMFTDKQHSKANREAMQQLLHSYIGQVVNGVAAARGLSPREVSKIGEVGMTENYWPIKCLQNVI